MSNPADPIHFRRVQQLRAAVYAQTDPTTSVELLTELAKAEAALRDAESKTAPPQAPTEAPKTVVAPAGRLLGPESTGLKVEPALTMDTIPTALSSSTLAPTPSDQRCHQRLARQQAQVGVHLGLHRCCPPRSYAPSRSERQIGPAPQMDSPMTSLLVADETNRI